MALFYFKLGFIELPLTTGHGMSVLHMRWAVWLRGDQLPGNLLTRRRQNTLLFLRPYLQTVLNALSDAPLLECPVKCQQLQSDNVTHFNNQTFDGSLVQ